LIGLHNRVFYQKDKIDSILLIIKYENMRGLVSPSDPGIEIKEK
jgi:hypothetical protein